MKEAKIKIDHPVHGHLDAYVNLHPQHGANITHYGHGGEMVSADDAHGDHEGGISDSMQSKIKAHALKMGHGDHSEKHEPLRLGEEMSKSEYTPVEAAITILKKIEELAKAEASKGADQKVEEIKTEAQDSKEAKNDIAKEEKGVHAPAESGNFKGPGTSSAGQLTRGANRDKNKAKLQDYVRMKRSAAKKRHAEKLQELKDMPKPNLPKGE
jgi:hypothetical protein